MSDYNSNGSVPVGIVSDSTVRVAAVNDTLSVGKKLYLPVVLTTATPTNPATGLFVLNETTGKLNFYYSGGWHAVTSA